MLCLGHIQVLMTPPYVLPVLTFPIYNTDIPISSVMNDSRDQVYGTLVWTHTRPLVINIDHHYWYQIRLKFRQWHDKDYLSSGKQSWDNSRSQNKHQANHHCIRKQWQPKFSMITAPIKTVTIAVECERVYGDKLSFQIFMFAHSSIWDTWLSQI